MNKLSVPHRIIIAIASLALIITYFVPVWFIFLLAPQYPEGLTMQIWLYKITGQVEIINGLNHYIGMKHISAEMFPEFGYMNYILGAYILFGLFVAFIGKRSFLMAHLILTLVLGAAAMIDFYIWSYDYGHNLDPKAAIQVPGLSYQPPLLGHKTLLNFDAYSYPDIGGWIFIVAAVLYFLVFFLNWRNRSKLRKIKARSASSAMIAGFMLFFLASCTTEPQPFALGKDICEECKMTLMDPRFGAEIITKKGRIFKFDDAHCVTSYLNNGKVEKVDISRTVFIDYQSGKEFVDAEAAIFVKSPAIKSPMNSQTAAYRNRQAADQKAKETNGAIMDWGQLMNRLR